MYHLNPKEKPHRSKDKLYLELLCQLQTKSYDTITIQLLAKKTGISRSTFYRNYSRVDEILLDKIDSTVYAYSQQLNTFSENYTGNLSLPFNLFKPSLEFWAKEYELIDCLMKIDRIHWLQNKVQEIDVSEYANHLSQKNLPIIDSTYILKIGYAIIINTISLWISGGRKESPSYLGDLLLEHLFAIDPKENM